jgi:glycine/D-amino acid oxidase-like deaminating enzyme
LRIRGRGEARPNYPATRAPALWRRALRSAAASPGKAPTFLVAALKDPDGGNLDRIQIVKGWVDASGQAQEKVRRSTTSRGPGSARAARTDQSLHQSFALVIRLDPRESRVRS